MNRQDRRRGTDGAVGATTGNKDGIVGVGKRTLVESLPGAAGAAVATGTAAPTAEVGKVGQGAPPNVDAGGTPYVEGAGAKDGPLSKEKARQILQDAFGSYTTIGEGKVEVLDQAAFQVAYDKIYGSTKWSWAR